MVRNFMQLLITNEVKQNKGKNYNFYTSWSIKVRPQLKPFKNDAQVSLIFISKPQKIIIYL